MAVRSLTVSDALPLLSAGEPWKPEFRFEPGVAEYQAGVGQEAVLSWENLHREKFVKVIGLPAFREVSGAITEWE